MCDAVLFCGGSAIEKKTAREESKLFGFFFFEILFRYMPDVILLPHYGPVWILPKNIFFQTHE